ncbi:hypothetical protein HPQ64_18980 [Rhizobiales bacterium]|uniref:hypothetical protein n=1 Tax=Hongsoonwoonella zoysiae TaxID=2821844 RepID=UPI00156197E2|nr:hypothetical protein [Hongsoonwoonella zoysiae]NRG19781.1 hypothetical protein [Hongsoonwoonella zoysiae]
MKRKIAGFSFRMTVLFAMAGFGLAACESVGDIGSKIVSGGGSGDSVVDVDASAFVAPPWCPPISVERNRYLLMKFQRGKENDARALEYQASIEKWATGCKKVDGQTQVKIGVSGRVTPGPAWEGGEILLPLKVTLRESGSEDEKDRSDIMMVPVTLGAGSPSEIWSLVETSITLPPEARPRVLVSLEDEGRR